MSAFSLEADAPSWPDDVGLGPLADVRAGHVAPPFASAAKAPEATSSAAVQMSWQHPRTSPMPPVALPERIRRFQTTAAMG